MRPQGPPLSILLLGLAVAPLLGCNQTSSGIEPELSVSIVGLAVTAISTSSHLAAELAYALASEEGGPCPVVFLDGDDVTIDFAAGCVPDSGLTEGSVTGQASLTMVSGGAMFDGELLNLGIEPIAMDGLVSGTAALTGSLLAGDVHLEAASWEHAGTPQSFDALVELDGDGSSLSVQIDSGSYSNANGVPVSFWAEDLSWDYGTLGGCAVPRSGSLRVERNNVSATVLFGDAGDTLSVSFSDQPDPETLTACN